WTGAQKRKIGWLNVIIGRTDRKLYELPDGVSLIGAEETACVKLTGMFAPKKAAWIRRNGGRYYLGVPETNQRVKLNARQLETERELKTGDTLQVGDVLLQFFLKEERRNQERRLKKSAATAGIKERRRNDRRTRP